MMGSCGIGVWFVARKFETLAPTPSKCHHNYHCRHRVKLSETELYDVNCSCTSGENHRLLLMVDASQNNNSVHCGLTVDVYSTAECCGYRSKCDLVLFYVQNTLN